MKSPTKSIEKNIAIYNYKDVTIYLRIMEPIKDRHVIWYQSLKCVLLIEYSTINLREESKHSITTLQVPALLLKQIGLLKNITLIDDNHQRLKKSVFKAYDIEQALKSPNIESMNKIFETSFSTLFAEPEGGKSKEINSYLKELYTLIYENISTGYVSKRRTLDLLSKIKELTQKREKHHKDKLRKENEIKRVERQNLTARMREIPLLIEAVTRPQTNFESNDTISIVGSIVSILILLKRFHLQYIERKCQQSRQYIDFELCKYDAIKASSCKISLDKLLNAYMAKSMKHANLGEQVQAILLFNTAITKSQEMQIILWLARIEASFITPLDIVKRFIFYCHDAWLPLPTPTAITSKNPFMTLNLANSISPQEWRQRKFFFWPDINCSKDLKSKKIPYASGIWTAILMEDYYQNILQSLIELPNSNYSENIINRFYIMADYITLLSVQPNSNLEAMPDLSKALEKSNDKNILWSLPNRFPTAIAKLEMIRIYQQEINFINMVKRLQNLIDKSFDLFNTLYHSIDTDIITYELYINTEHYELSNSKNLARYITDSQKAKSIKDCNNWPKSHHQHIDYYITSIIKRLHPIAPDNNNKELLQKKAYLIALKILHKIYQQSKRSSKGNYSSKEILFPSKNNHNPTNDHTEILRQFLFEPIITCIIFNLNPQDYFYLPLKIKLNRYKQFVEFLYQSETLSLNNNLIRK
ncbi:MAG: hypothetical protein E7A19_01645 [Veillonella sp.]|uniref:hypothetical protein n=1 Tax=Veillonella sp. TaxID=1926307 RepID=UPI0029015B40|nr:hypothetical protein [Veillonella sp.]MDU1129553.1 hypothetical protein [Veillonella sp.]